jgi:hypothetical protein
VDQVSVDVRCPATAHVFVYGEKGQELLSAAPASTFTTLTAGSNDVIAQDAAGNDIKLGPIKKVLVFPFTFLAASGSLELDNVRAVVFFPGISSPPVARDDVYELPQDAQPGQTFDSHIFHRSSDPNGSVLDNDTSNSSGLFLAMPSREPAHGFLSWNSNDDGTFTYIPDSSFRGTDSFTYMADDAGGFSNEATVTIVTAGSALDTDGDGAPDDVEALVPPGTRAVYGDGNNDGTPDYLQPRVASAFDTNFQYTTLVASDGAFQDVSIDPVPASPPPPGGVTLTSGLYKFQLTGLSANEPAVVTLTPASDTALISANAFYVLDPGSGTWSSFNLDAGTGVGATVTGADVTLHLAGSASGVIALQGAPASVQLTAYPGEVTFVHQPGDFTVPKLTGKVGFVAPPGETVTVSKVLGSEVGGTVDLPPDGSFVWYGAAPDASFQFLVTDAGGASSGPALETIHVQGLPPLFDEVVIYTFDAVDNELSDFDPRTGQLHQLATFDPHEPNGDGGNDLFSRAEVQVADSASSYHPARDVDEIPPLGVVDEGIGFHNLTPIVVQPPIRASSFHLNPDDGTFSYLPLPGFKGIDVFHVKVNDGYLDGNTTGPSVRRDYITVVIQVLPSQLPEGEAPDYTPTDFDAAGVQVQVGNQDELVQIDAGYSDQTAKDVPHIPNPSPLGDLPPGTQPQDFPLGFFQFTVITSLSPPNALVQLVLPPAVPAPTKYYKYGPTPDDLTPHWYDFAFDDDPASPDFQTGAVFPGQTDPVTGETVPAGAINLHFRSGRRSDDNLGGAGIGDPGGPVFFAPAASVTGPAAGTAGQPVTFALSAADPSPAAQAAGFTYTIDWGDGSPGQTVAAAPGNGAGVAAGHVFARPGAFTVRVTATDPSGLAGPAATATIAVTAPSPPAIAPPSITGLSPGSARANQRHLTLAVSGLHFSPASAVTFNGHPLQTTFVSDTLLAVPDFLLQVRPLLQRGRRRLPLRTKGKGLVAVVDPVGGISAPILFVIR